MSHPNEDKTLSVTLLSEGLGLLGSIIQGHRWRSACSRPVIEKAGAIADLAVALNDAAQRSAIADGDERAKTEAALRFLAAFQAFGEALTQEIVDWLVADARDDDGVRIFLSMSEIARRLGRHKANVSRAVSAGRLRNHGSAARPLIDLAEASKVFRGEENVEA